MHFRTKLLLIMKFTALLIFAACLSTSASTYSQSVSYSARNAEVKQVFAAIKKQTGYSFFYNNEDLKGAHTVSVDLKNEPLDKALEALFKDQPFTYRIDGKTIFIKAKPQPLAVASIPMTAEQPLLPPMVHGRITNEKGEAVAGVNISIKGGKVIGVTNDNGEFTLTNVPDGAVLVFSAMTVETLEVKLNGRSDLVLQAKTKVSELEEVVVSKGYYDVKQWQNTGNVVTVKGDVIEKQPVNNPMLALEGRVAGLLITQSNGLPGGNVSVQLRGKNSIAQGVEPLYIVDGVPFTSKFYPSSASPGLGGIFGGGGGNPLSLINPLDIESITILKDADATSIYGSRAANGVVLITTKSGKAGSMKVSANIQYGFGNVTRKLKLMNTDQYLQMRKEALKNDNLVLDVNNILMSDLTSYSQTSNTDWQKAMIGGTSHYSDAQVSVSGGSASTTYLISSNYHKETTVFPGNWNDQKGAFHFNITNTSLNQKLKIALSGSFISDHNLLPPSDFTNYILLAPNSPSLTNADGSLNWKDYYYGNPFSLLYSSYVAKTSNLIASSDISYKIITGLNFKVSLGYNDIQIDENNQLQIGYNNPVNNVKTGSANFNNNNLKSWSVEPQLNYELKIGKNNFSILAGTTLQNRNTQGQILQGNGYVNDALLGTLSGAGTITKGNTVYEQYRYNAIYGKAGYIFDDKYILNATARRDGSSRFGPFNKFGNFGSLAAGWIFSKETIFSGLSKIIDFGKLRTSYGTSGNEPAFSYQYLELFGYINGFNPYGGITGISPNNLQSGNFAWEVNKKFEIGLDLNFLNNRINFSGSYYVNRTSNQLVNYSLPSIVGLGGVIANLPATVQNTSLEFAITAFNIKKANFNWTTNINITFPKNKLVAFPNIENTSYNSSLVIGQPITINKVFRFANIDPQTGLYRFYDKNGNYTANPISGIDNTSLVNAQPKYYGGIENSITYKSLTLSFLLQFTKQIGINSLFTNNAPGFFAPGLNSNKLSDNLDHWQKVGDNQPFQKYTTTRPPSNGIAQASDAVYTDASYLRLRNLSLAFNLSPKALKKLSLSGLKIFVLSQNLFTLTKYKGADPETQSILMLPPLRVITGGVQITL